MYLHARGHAPDGTPAHWFEVYLDGKRVSKCIEADDEAGFVRCYEIDENGHIVLDKDKWEPKVVEHRGKVEFRRKTA